MNFANLIASLKNDEASVDRALAALVDDASNTVVQADVAKQRGKVISSAFMRQQQTIAQLQKQLAALYAKEEEGFAAFVDMINGHLTTDTEAFMAQSLYDLAWFAGLLFSIEAKVTLAQNLIRVVSRFNPSYTSPLWHNISELNPATLQLIAVR